MYVRAVVSAGAQSAEGRYYISDLRDVELPLACAFGVRVMDGSTLNLSFSITSPMLDPMPLRLAGIGLQDQVSVTFYTWASNETTWSAYGATLQMAYPTGAAATSAFEYPGSLSVALNTSTLAFIRATMSYCSRYSSVLAPQSTLGTLLSYDVASATLSKDVVCAAGYFDVEAALQAPNLSFSYSFDSVPASAARLLARADANAIITTTTLATRFNIRITVMSGTYTVTNAYSSILPAQFSAATTGNTSRFPCVRGMG